MDRKIDRKLFECKLRRNTNGPPEFPIFAEGTCRVSVLSDAPHHVDVVGV